jgi:hypothetical protein
MITTKGKQILPLSKENILLFITDEQIFRRYIDKNFEIGEVFSSPLRPGSDPHPSFAVYYNRFVQKLMYKDHGAGGDGGDCFKFVMRLYKCNFWEACNQINSDFNLNLGGISKDLNLIKQINHDLNIKKEKKDIKFLTQEFNEKDLKDWNSYGITINTLNKYNVYCVNRYWVNDSIRRVYTDKFPIYAYYFPRTKNKKIYIPNEVFPNKWFSNANNEWDIQGYDQLPDKGDLCIITKSMKDVMCLYELGYNAVATHGEGHYINPDFIRHLKERFKKIIFFYDNDKPGLICGERMSALYDCKYTYIPVEFEEKDISDFYKNHGKRMSEEILKNII